MPSHRTPSDPRGLVMLLGVLVATMGCQQAKDGAQPAAGGEVVATYTGHTLTSEQVKQEFERLPGPSRTFLTAPDRKRQFIENMVMNELLYDEGKREGLDKDPDVERQVNELRKRLVVQRVMRKYQTPPPITDEQVRASYNQNVDLYSTTQIRASHILVREEETAKQLLAELRATPGKFAELAQQKSTDTTSAKKGGDLGTFGQGRMVPEFERAAFRLKAGEMSDVVKTQYGYHIILVTERKEGEPKPFDQVKDQIRAALRNQALQTQVQGHFDEIKKTADLKIDDEALGRVTPPSGPPPSPHGGGH